jgi:hypothetical protein
VTAYLTHRNIAFGFAVMIGLGAFAGSARELWRIAETANYGLPVGLVAALDGLAVVCVIVLARHRDWQAVVTLAAATLLSIGLQILAVPRDHVVDGATIAVPVDRYVSAVLVHALVPLASFMAIHLATRLDRPQPEPTTEPVNAGPVPAVPPAPPEPETTPQPPATPQPAPKAKPAAARPPERPAVRGRSMDELVADARALADRQGVGPARLTQRQLMSELGIGSKRAADLAGVFKIADELATDDDLVTDLRARGVPSASIGELQALGSGTNGTRP